MKKLLILLIAVLIFSCSTEDDSDSGCTCEKETWLVEHGVAINPTTGLPYLTITETLVATEDVVCQDEAQVLLQNDYYYKIICN